MAYDLGIMTLTYVLVFTLARKCFKDIVAIDTTSL